MPRPKGMRRDDHARGVFQGAALTSLFILVLIIACVALVYDAGAKTAERCISPEQAKEQAEKSGNVVVAMEDKGKAAKYIIDRVNKTGRPTNYQGDHIIMWRTPPYPPSQMMFFKEGCATVACIQGEGCTELKDSTPKPEASTL